MKRSLILLTIFTIIGVYTRTIWHIAPNVEFVTAMSLLSIAFVRNTKIAFFQPLLILLVSDFIIGNTNILLFTWSGFLFTPIMMSLYNSNILKQQDFIKNCKIDTFMVPSIMSVLFFFLWTNFGVVVLTNMYTHNIEGLMQSYVNALPFLKNQLLGNIIIITSVFLILKSTYYLKNKRFQQKQQLQVENLH